jgi:hypothetical protein
MWLLPNTKPNLDVDVISLAPPFHAEAYRKMVFNGFDGPLWSLMRWTTEPRFCIKTSVENGGSVLCQCTHIAQNDVQVMTAMIRRLVPMFTGGRYPSVRVDSGPGEPTDTTDTIVIRMTFFPDILGRAAVAANPGRIELTVGHPNNCGVTFFPAVLTHEVGHALGYWHHDYAGVMFPGFSDVCANTVPTAVEQQLAAVAYTRVPGTSYPDTAQQNTAFMRPSGSPPALVVD